jgi:ketosteroid isomerase-like protein
MAEHSLAEHMEQVVRNYFRACKNADAKGVAACFCPDAVHYFPGRARLVGAEAIGWAIVRSTP